MWSKLPGMSRSFPHLAALAALVLGGSLSAQAQLWATPPETARQPVLKGFTAQEQGKVLRLGDTTVTLDTVAGRVVGVLIEGRDVANVARGLSAAWGADAEDATRLAAQLSAKGFQDRARLGLVQPSDENGTDLLAVRLTGSGSTQRWRIYSALNVIPESQFPSTRNVTGKASAPHVIHVLSDFQCPACRQLWSTELPKWRKQPDVYQVHYHHFPLSYHANAAAAAEASECAAQQGKFWNYADELFAQFSRWTRMDAPQAQKQFGEYASRLKLGRAAFDQCLSKHQPKAEVARQMKGADSLFLTGTPTVYLNGVKLTDWSPEEMRRIQAVTRAKPDAASVIAARLKTFR